MTWTYFYLQFVSMKHTEALGSCMTAAASWTWHGKKRKNICRFCAAAP